MVVNIRHYLQLLRVNHWIKNILIFIPLFFNQNLFYTPLMFSAVWGFICFSLLSSIVYIFNDIHDLEKDRRHSTKSRRPLASGDIPVSHAKIVQVILLVVLITLLTILTISENNLYDIIWEYGSRQSGIDSQKLKDAITADYQALERHALRPYMKG